MTSAWTAARTSAPVAVGPAIVALVCSAGGLDALTTILEALPPEFPAAVIVGQHQAPDRPNPLADLLSRHCRLPVTVAQNGEEFRAGNVVVVPPHTHALATVDNRIALIASDGTPPYRPSADLLLGTPAVTAGTRTVAVILSGEGNDGATGATAVHDSGGVVVASDRATSGHFAMPLAAIRRDNVVDWVLPLQRIAPALVSIVGGVRA